MGTCKEHGTWRDGEEVYDCPMCSQESEPEPDIDPDTVTLILRPIDDSNDQVLVCDRYGCVCGALHVDAFLDGRHNPVYDALWNGEEIVVEVRLADD